MATGILGTQRDLSGLTYTEVYTCPSDTFAVAALSVLNRGASNVTVRIAITTQTPPSAPTNAEFIEYDVTIAPSGVLERTGIVLQAGKIISVYANNTGVSVTAMGIETATA